VTADAKKGAQSMSIIPGHDPSSALLAQLRPYVRHCGASRRDPWHMEPRKLLDYLLVYIAEGSGRFSIGGQAYDAVVNDLFWIPPDTVHEMRGFAPAMTCPHVHFDLIYRPELSHWDFSIPGGMLDLGELQPLLHPPLPQLQCLSGRIRTHTNERVGDLLRQVCSEALRAQPYSGLHLSGLILQIVAELLRGQAGLSADASHYLPVLEKIARQMRNECQQPLLEDRLATEARVCPSYFRRLFTVHFGCPPRTYLRNARIQRAKELLYSSQLRTGEIATACGFSNSQSFSRAFHAVEGMPPSQYRRCGRTAIVRAEGRDAGYSH